MVTTITAAPDLMAEDVQWVLPPLLSSPFPLCIVNRGSASIQSQQESPMWGEVKEETLFSANISIMMLSPTALQFIYEIAWLWDHMATRQPWLPGPSLARELCSTPLQSAPLCCSKMSSVSQLQPRKHSFQSLVEREGGLYEPQGNWLIQREVLTPGPWLDHAHVKGL